MNVSDMVRLSLEDLRTDRNRALEAIQVTFEQSVNRLDDVAKLDTGDTNGIVERALALMIADVWIKSSRLRTVEFFFGDGHRHSREALGEQLPEGRYRLIAMVLPSPGGER
jgi:hypothetical protein